MSHVQPLKRGDIVVYQDQRTWLLAACDLVNIPFYCATCEVDLPSRGHLLAHVASPTEKGKPHEIARNCIRHGLEAPPEKAKEQQSA